MLLKTKHLIVRKFTEADLDDLAILLGDPEVMRFSLSGPILEREKVQQYLQKWVLNQYEKHGFGPFAVIHQQDQKFMGYMGLLMQLIDGEELVELGYRLLPQYWGKGYATEAGLAVSRYAFDELKLDRLISIIDPNNTRSIQVAKRVGMHFWKEAVLYKIPVHIYSLKKGNHENKAALS
jgi:RimJ/RimL family protein N-acetyltransferase